MCQYGMIIVAIASRFLSMSGPSSPSASHFAHVGIQYLSKYLNDYLAGIVLEQSRI